MKRRQALQTLGSVLLGWPLAARAAERQETIGRKILLFSRSVLYEHSVIQRHGNELSFAEKIFVALARQAGCDVECTKDGRVFDGDLSPYAAVVTYSCGRPADLMKPEGLDHSPPLSERGWKNLDASVRGGLPLMAIHPGLWLLPQAFGGLPRARRPAGRQNARYLAAIPRHGRIGPVLLVSGGVVLARPVRQGPARRPRAGLYRDEHARAAGPPLLRSAAFSRHLGSDVRQGASVLYLDGSPRGRVDEPDFPADRGRRAVVDSGRLQADITPNIEQVAPRANDFMKT